MLFSPSLAHPSELLGPASFATPIPHLTSRLSAQNPCKGISRTAGGCGAWATRSIAQRPPRRWTPKGGRCGRRATLRGHVPHSCISPAPACVTARPRRGRDAAPHAHMSPAGRVDARAPRLRRPASPPSLFTNVRCKLASSVNTLAHLARSLRALCASPSIPALRALLAGRVPHGAPRQELPIDDASAYGPRVPRQPRPAPRPRHHPRL